MLLTPSFQSVVNDMTQIHSPAIMVITKTKVSGPRAREITDRLRFDGAIHAKNFGFTSGL